MNWIGLFAKLLGPLGSYALSRWLLKAEFKGGKYVVYLSERRESPFADIHATIRIRNRRDSSTTIFCDSFRVKLNGRTDDFDLPEIRPLGAPFSVLESHRQLQVGANSTIDISFYSRKHYLEQVPEQYLSRRNVRLHVLLKETFGASETVEGELECADVVRQ